MRVAIVGAGLSGLYAAWRLTEADQDVRIYEARNRTGGRISTASGGFDLGPAWFWPDHQGRLPHLLADLGLDAFPQFSDGAMMFEPPDGPIQRVPPQPMGPPSYRIVGGAAALTDALAAKLPDGTIALSASVDGLACDGAKARVTSAGISDTFDLVLLAMPPRLAGTLNFSPSPAPEIVAAWQRVPTWMAAHAKLVAVYDTPFWRADGLAGNAFSYRGPMMEIHDASPVDAAQGALFGFIGVAAAERRGRDKEVKEAAVAQLARLFGEAALNPTDVLYEDWSASPFTATDADATGPAQHPEYGPVAIPDAWVNRIAFIGTEVASQQGGYMEGCLIAVDEALDALSSADGMA